VGLYKECDLFVRPTNTDDEAVSIREALHVGTPVVAIDIVRRPAACILFETHNMEQFENAVRKALIDLKFYRNRIKFLDDANNAKKITNLYKKLLKEGLIMTWAEKKVLITGASGFIGSHLVEALAKNGTDVRAFVHYNSRNDIGNLSFLDDDLLKSVEVIWGDVTDEGMVRHAVKGCDCVFHLAALIGIPYSYVAPSSYVNTNIKGTLNVLEAVREFGVSKMVHTSTSECYGTALYEPIDESHPLQGQSPYSASKIGADKLAESYYRSFDVPVATIRPFNTYGPRQSDRAVIPTIIKQLILHQDTISLGSLTPCRDLTFVEDTVNAFIKIAENSATVGQTINIGNGETISVGDLALKIINMTDPRVKIVSKEERRRPEKSEVMKLICNNKKAKEIIGWSPNVTLNAGIESTVKFIKDHRHLYIGDSYTV